ncbi:MAG: response regulator, partial [Deltaproteobacteria bacterium]|nr:response regulator [Deltaproteobacteria bacterium]
DTGSGISKEDINRIFEPFYTKKVLGRSGTGLGLAVVWNTVQDHGGGIIVESDDKGTTFKLYFPATREDLSKQIKNIRFGELKGHGEKILIINDEALQQDVAVGMLTALGYQVDSVGSGEEAIEYLEKNPVDLLVLDMIMDPGMGGRKTYEQVIKLYPGQKAIIASGFSENKDVKNVQKIGAGQFIEKPYTMNRIGSAVWQALHE